MTKKTTARTPAVKLNAEMRTSLVSSIIRDIPVPNFDKEAARMEKKLLAELPPKLRAALNDNHARQFVRFAAFRATTSYSCSGGGRHTRHQATLFNLRLPAMEEFPDRLELRSSGFKLCGENNQLWPRWTTPELRLLAATAAHAVLTYQAACEQVRLAVAACGTTKHLRDRHPHFNEYTDKMLAEFRPATESNLPDDSLAHTLAKLGWPDGVEPSATKADAVTTTA